MTTLLTKPELAQELKISIAAIGNYQQMGMPVHRVGSAGRSAIYNLDHVKEWMQDNLRQADKTYNELKAEKLLIEIQLAEIELQRERGELVDIDIAVKQVEEAFSRVRAKVMGLPSRVSGIVYSMQSQREVQAYLEQSVIEILEELVSDFTGETATETDEAVMEYDEFEEEPEE
jgi:phage terminase Nu1 subunit (DNA packaging protein)